MAKKKRLRAKKVSAAVPDGTTELGITPAADSAAEEAPTPSDVMAQPRQGCGGNQLSCGMPGGLPDTMPGTFLSPQPLVDPFVVPRGHGRGMPLMVRDLARTVSAAFRTCGSSAV